MRWIESQSFIGLDRRSTRKFRVIERRRIDLSSRLPSLPTKLRQMRVQAMGAGRPDVRLALARQVIASAGLAKHQGYIEVAERLKALAENLTSPPSEPLTPSRIDQELDTLLNIVAGGRTP